MLSTDSILRVGVEFSHQMKFINCTILKEKVLFEKEGVLYEIEGAKHGFVLKKD